MIGIRISSRTFLIRSLSGIAGVAGLLGLYFGTGMLFLVPGYPGESFFTLGRIGYGLLPSILGLSFLVFAGWLWAQSKEANLVSTYLKRAVVGAVAIVGLFWLVLILVAKAQHRIP